MDQIDKTIFNYCKKLYLLFGTEWFPYRYLHKIVSNPYYDFFRKENISSQDFMILHTNGFLDGDGVDWFESSKLRFTPKFIKYMEDHCE